MELKLNAVQRATWLPVCLTVASRAASVLLAAGSLVCLVVAGVHYAVSSGLYILSEIQGTRIVISYSLSLSVLMGAASVAGIVPRSLRFRAAVLGGGAAVCAVAAGACEASACFGATDCAFGLDFLHGINIVLGAACIAVACVGAGLWVFFAPGAQDEDPVDEGLDVASGDLAADDGEFPAEEVAEDASAELVAEASDDDVSDDDAPAEDDPAAADGAAGSSSEPSGPARLEGDEEA